MFTIHELIESSNYQDLCRYYSDCSKKYYGIHILEDGKDSQYDPDVLYLCKASKTKSLAGFRGKGILVIGKSVFPVKNAVENFQSSRCQDYTVEIAALFSSMSFAEVTAHLINACTSMMKKEKIRDDILNIFLVQKEISGIIRKAAYTLQAPIILTTSSYRVLAMEDAGLVFQDKIWEDALKTGFCSADSVASFEDEDVTGKVLSSSEAFLLDSGLAESIPRILDKVIIDKKVCAYLGVFMVDRTCTREDLEHVTLISRLLSLKLSESRSAVFDVTRRKESILSDLIDGLYDHATVLNDAISSTGWNPSKNHRCAVFVPRNTSKGILNGDFIRHSLETSCTGIHTIQRGNEIIVLADFPVSGTFEPYTTFFRQIAAKYNLQVAVSIEFRDLIKLRFYYTSALEAIEVLRILHKEEKEECMVFYEDVVAFVLSRKITHDERAAYQQTIYKYLIRYDRLHGTEYCRTLTTYILSGCSRSIAADRLFIHRNTMTHRLDRITELTSLDFNDGKTLFYFLLSYYVDQWDQLESRNVR